MLFGSFFNKTPRHIHRFDIHEFSGAEHGQFLSVTGHFTSAKTRLMHSNSFFSSDCSEVSLLA